MSLIPEKLQSRLLYIALLACVITIPLSNNLNSIAVIFFVATCVLAQPWKKTKENLLTNKFWILPVIYFLWYACSYFWDVTGGFTNKEIERYAILFFVPAACAAIPKIDAIKVRRACIIFAVTTIVISVMCLIKAVIEYRETGDYRVFYYQYLGEQMHLNAIFLSNYCLASITWLLYFGYMEKGSRRLHHHLLIIGGCVFLLVMIYLLSSKLIIVLTIMVLFVFILLLGYTRGWLWKALLLTVLLIASAALAVSKLDYLKWRITSTEFKRYSGPQDDQNGIAIRLFMWETTADLIKERPLLGYGIRGARETLLDEYERKGFRLGVTGFYHSHNQYLESLLMGGIPALLMLLTIIAGILRRALLHRNFLLLLIALHFVIQSIFEATFEVQHELVFYFFFIFLFYYHSPKWSEQNKTRKDGENVML